MHFFIASIVLKQVKFNIYLTKYFNNNKSLS